ncbi:MAG TPA: ABC transporter ATP-binding protein, partial [Tistrella mobilis]|nr:ABC transporter ATP-binding protein [Tistrella mobilis]
AIIGPNGAGKSSMLNIISGFYTPSEGELWYKGSKRPPMKPYEVARMGVARTFQNIALFEGMSVLDNVMTGRLTKMHAGIASQALWWGKARDEEIDYREVVEKIIDFLEIQAIRKTPVGRLPYGLQKRVELARALAMEPELLLLDEPMAGMNLEEKEDMARFIIDLSEEWGMTIIMIEHDMGVVADISHRIMVLDFGRKLAEGSAEDVLNDEHVKKAYLGEDDDEEAVA